jgi:hypothetical protein
MKGYTIQVHYPEWVIFDDSGRIVGSYGSRDEANARRNVLIEAANAEDYLNRYIATGSQRYSVIVSKITSTDSQGVKSPAWLCEIFERHVCASRQDGVTASDAVQRALAPFIPKPVPDAPDSVGAWYARQAKEADDIRQQIAAEKDPRKLRELKKALEMALYVGD